MAKFNELTRYVLCIRAQTAHNLRRVFPDEKSDSHSTTIPISRSLQINYVFLLARTSDDRKDLTVDTTNLRIRLDGNEHDYSLTDADYSWLLLFTYNHSSHLVEVGLGKAPIPEFPSVQVVVLLLIAIIIVTKLVRVNHARTAEPSLPPA